VNATRTELHRICAHVLGRRRYEVSGHFGLRVGADGVVTPAFGPEPEVLRIASGWLIREVGKEAATIEIGGSTLADLAAFAGTDLGPPFSVGGATPPLGDIDAPIELDDDACAVLVQWWELGATVLDAVGEQRGDQLETVQLWPEHFDLATVVTLPSGKGANLGFSPGDGYSDEPYAYVGPWDGDRPGDREYWNAPFGALRSRTDCIESDDAHIDCVAFMLRGLAYLSDAEDVLTTKGTT
jgi:hypothetical protein